LSRLRKLTTIVLLGLLAACAGGTDNSEPPALLTTIKEAIPLDKNWVVDTRASSNRAAFRLRPLIIGDFAYTIDTGGLIRAVSLSNGRLIWRHKTGLEPITGVGGNSRLLIATSRNGDVIAYRQLEKGLETLWTTRLDSEIRATPVVDGDQVFVRSVDGRLRSLSISPAQPVH